MSNEIILKKLILKNFKGIKDSTIDFGKITNVYGENGTGKTTIQDAFTFLLFDKDSKDSSKFDVQPLDKLNNPIHNLETIIEATLNVDGKDITLKRVYKEKYSKVRGTSKTDFKGYESDYYVNEVPQKVTEYKKFIGTLLDENIFKLVTNPVCFASLPWKERRTIITEIVGDLDNLVVLDSKKELEPLRKHLKEYTVNEFMKMNKAKVNKLKEDRSKLPVRIDEANKSIQKFEFEALEIEKISILKGVKSIDERIQDKSKANEGLYELKSKLMKNQSELEKLEYEIKANANMPIYELERKIRNIESETSNLNTLINDSQLKIMKGKARLETVLNPRRNELLREYKEIKDSTFEFDESTCICPTCRRKFEATDIEAKREEFESNFNLNKAKKLEMNVNEGKSISSEIKSLEADISGSNKKVKEYEESILQNKSKVESLKNELNNLKVADVTETEEIIKIKNEIAALDKEIQNFKQADTSDLKAEKQELQRQLSDIDKKLAFKETNEKTLKRIEDLKAEECKLSEKIAELEGLEMLSEDFTRTKVELLEEKVNSKFKYVKFKMFRNQINGGLEECAEPCINGVPFTSNLNSASKINAGLDIINTLCNHYKVNAPIFIDNRESTNRIIDVKSQVINLIVSKDKELKIEIDIESEVSNLISNINKESKEEVI